MWSGRYENEGVLLTARPGRDGRRQEQKVKNQRLRQATVVWSGRYENDGVLLTARPGRDGRRQSRRCRTEGCGKIPSFGVAGTKTVEYCLQHATDGMVDVKSRKCRTEGCGKRPSFGVAGTKT